MRFLAYTLGSEADLPTDPPSIELMTEMDAFIKEATEAGVLLATGGVAPLAEKIKVSYKDGQFSVLDGPFTEAKELIGGWALMEVRDRDEAIEWSRRFLAIAGEGESTLRQTYGPDDGFGPTE